MILVIGEARSGTSLLMQMLHAAGLNCRGEWPAFEDSRYSFAGADFSDLGPDDAAKVLWVDPLAIPARAQCILTSRNHRARTASEIKFGRAVGLPWEDTRHVRRRMRKDSERMQRQIDAATRGRARLRVAFERLVELEPDRVADELAAFIGRPEVAAAMQACVRPRSAACYDGFLEIDLVGHVHADHGPETA